MLFLRFQFPYHSRSSNLFLSSSAEMDVIRSNTDVLVKTGLGTRAEEDFLLARDTCVALLKLKKTKVKHQVSKGGEMRGKFATTATDDISALTAA